VSMFTYYVMIECANCDAECHYGPCGTTLGYRGLPVVVNLKQERLDCENCGAINYVGEVDVFAEGGRPEIETRVTQDEEAEEDEDETTTS
jgi:hypothetical protein